VIAEDSEEGLEKSSFSRVSALSFEAEVVSLSLNIVSSIFGECFRVSA
jgi:hypothetical protein